MANKTTASTATPKQPTAAELREWYAKNQKRMEKYAVSEEVIKKLRDITKNVPRKTIQAFDKDTIVSYLQNPGANERNLRNLSRYLYYRSHIYFRVIEFYSNMLMPEARTIIPRTDLVKGADNTKMLKSYNDTADILERMNLNRNMKKVMTTVLREDIFYGLYWLDDTGIVLKIKSSTLDEVFKTTKAVRIEIYRESGETERIRVPLETLKQWKNVMEADLRQIKKDRYDR